MMYPSDASMATRPCVSSASRYLFTSAGLVFSQNPAGSQNPRGGEMPGSVWAYSKPDLGFGAGASSAEARAFVLARFATTPTERTPRPRSCIFCFTGTTRVIAVPAILLSFCVRTYVYMYICVCVNGLVRSLLLLNVAPFLPRRPH